MNRNSQRFGKLRNDAADLIVKSTKTPAYIRAYIHLARYFKNGEAVETADRKNLERWLEKHHPGVDPSAVQTVNFSIASLAEEAFHGTKNSARNAIAGMVSHGLIQLVSKGVRGHCSLYVTLPLPEPEPP
ncbi:MAG: hypothetical protein RSC68_22295 [Acinetobacter sp.]